jgi:nitrate/TMAO reductase-like tetraheme cytochrome c subunit
MLNLPKRSIYAKHRVLFIWAGIVVEVVLLVALAVLAIVVFGAIYYRVTEDPKFCGSLCHNMSASYDSYKSSSHSGVLCAECHSEPGLKGTLKAVTVDAAREIYIYMEGEDFYDMDELHPEIHDESCLRHECHQIERLVEQKNLFMDDNVFIHGAHLSAVSAQTHGDSSTATEMSHAHLALNCTSCPSQSKERHLAVDKQVCFLCHFDSQTDASKMRNCNLCHAIPAPDHDEYMADEDIESCSDCHEMATEDITVPPEKCAECHEISKHPLDSASAHRLHVGPQEARCMECHEAIEHEL